MNETAIITASITGIIAMVGIIIQIITFKVKHKHDTRNNFEQVLKEKLENIYSPLVIYISDNQDSEFLESGSIKILISKFGHLLSRELLDDIREVFNIQLLDEGGKEKIYSSNEYQNLISKIINRINKDFYELQDIYNINYTNYKKSLYTPSYVRITQITVKGCIFITVSFYLIWGSLHVLLDIVPKESIFNNVYVDILMTFFMMIVIFTTLFGIPAILLYISEKWNEITRKKRKRYITNEYVPETGLYFCRICKRKEKLVKYSRFPLCNKHNSIQIIKNIFMIYSWKRFEETKNLKIKKAKLITLK